MVKAIVSSPRPTASVATVVATNEALTHPAPRVAKILKELLEHGPPARLVEAFLGAGHVPERFARGSTRGLRAHPLGDKMCCFEIEMGLNLVRKILMRAAAAKPSHGATPF